MMAKGVSIIVINYGRSDLVMNFLDSIRNSADSKVVSEVVIVDNGYPQKGNSRDVINVSSFPFKIKFVQNPESSYASGVNRGAALAKEEVFIIANNDIEFLPNHSIQPLLECLLHDPSVGIVGPQLVYPDGTWQRSYGRFPSLKEAVESLTMIDSIRNEILKRTWPCLWSVGIKSRLVDYIDGAFMAVRRQCFEELGGFDESFSFYGEDADFCWRAWKRGWKVVFVPSARVIHLRGATSMFDEETSLKYSYLLFVAKRQFVEKHYGKCHALWYMRFMKVGLLERFILYSLAAKLIRSRAWQRRAFEARIRYYALKRRICVESSRFGVGD